MPAPRKTLEYHREEGTHQNTTERAPSELQAGRSRARRDLKAEAREHFRRVSKLLGQRGHETPADGELLTLYSEVYLDYLEARQIVEREGRMVSDTVLTSHGVPIEKRKPHPLLKEIARCQSQLAALLRDLGLTVISRDRPKKPLPPPPPKGARYAKPGTVAYDMLREDPATAQKLWPGLLLMPEGHDNG